MSRLGEEVRTALDGEGGREGREDGGVEGGDGSIQQEIGRGGWTRTTGTEGTPDTKRRKSRAWKADSCRQICECSKRGERGDHVTGGFCNVSWRCLIFIEEVGILPREYKASRRCSQGNRGNRC